MSNNTISVSAFDTPEYLWELLLKGHKLDFREYEESGIPPDIFYLNDLDLVTRWDECSRSMAGLQSALLSNASRLIEWKFKSWWGRSSNDSPLFNPYSRLAKTYSAEITKHLMNYFSVHRIIEAKCCYARFLVDEQTLLSTFKFSQIFDWETRYKQRAILESFPPPEAAPEGLAYKNEDILEQGEGYLIKRVHSSFSGSCTRDTVVTLDNNHQITPAQIAEWLSRGYILHFGGKKIFEPEDDGSVFGTDAYGQDFYAGHISDPLGILSSIGTATFAERLQEH